MSKAEFVPSKAVVASHLLLVYITLLPLKAWSYKDVQISRFLQKKGCHPYHIWKIVDCLSLQEWCQEHQFDYIQILPILHQKKQSFGVDELTTSHCSKNLYLRFKRPISLQMDGYSP